MKTGIDSSAYRDPADLAADTRLLWLRVIGALLIAAAAIVLILAVKADSPLCEAAGLKLAEFHEGMDLYIQDAIPLHQYAYDTYAGITSHYEWALAFEIAGGETVVASLRLALNDRIGNFSARPHEVDGQRITFYAETEPLDASLEAPLATCAEGSTVVALRLTHLGDSEEEYRAMVWRRRRMYLWVATLLLLTALGCLLYGRGEPTPEEEEREELRIYEDGH